MKLFRYLKKVFRNYSDADRGISFACLAIILLMVIKMIIFPYGLFNFGKVDIYTEGLVGKNGFQNLNPMLVDYNDLDREVCRLVFSGLMKYDTNTRAIIGDMANLTINEEKTEYTFVLKEGLKWQDGEDLTVEDVFFTFSEVVQDPTFPNEILKTNFDGVDIVVVNENTIRFTLEKPNVFFITNLTTGILPEHILEDVPVVDLLRHKFNKQPIGSGPYMVSEPVEKFKDGRMQVSLKVNKYYYGINPKLENFRFISYPTEQDLMASLHSVNGIVKVSGDSAEAIKATSEFVMFAYQLPQYMAVFMNLDSPKLEEHMVRLALLKAVDKSVLIERLKDKKALDTPLLELDTGEWVYEPHIGSANGAIFDAGYSYPTDDSEFRAGSDGAVLDLILISRAFDEGTSQAKEMEIATNYLIEQWNSIGIKITHMSLPVSDLNERIMDRSYDLLFIGQTLGYNLDTYSYLHSTQVGANGLNLSNYKSFHVDSLIEDIRNTFDEVKRTEKLKQIADRLSKDIPAIYLYKPVYYYASNGKVNGVDMTGVSFPSDRFSNISEWQFDRK